MGEGENRESRSKAQAKDECGWQKEDCSGSEGEMGEGKGGWTKVALVRLDIAGSLGVWDGNMSTKRKILIGVFLVLFICGGLLALIGEITAAFLYWFFIAVVFLGLWFLLGPGTTPNEGAALTSKTKVFLFSFGKSMGGLLLIAVTMVVLTAVTSGDATAVGRAIGAGLAIGTLAALVRSLIKAVRHREFLAKSPSGTIQRYTPEQLRQSFLSGEVTTEWVVRSHGQTCYRPVSEVLYPTK